MRTLKSSATDSMVCIIPVGSFEQHGPHLPPTVDTEIAQHVANALGEKIGARVLPPLFYTCSDEHKGFPQTISVSCRRFIPYLEDVVRSAAEKCGAVIVVVGHGGVWEAVSMVTQQINYAMGPVAFAVNIWTYAAPRDHAGTDETSIYLATGGRLIGEMPEICEGDVSLFGKMPVHAFSSTGIVGCLKPSEVSAERGRALLDKAIEKMVKKVGEFLALTGRTCSAPRQVS
ncbi:MAG: creatininase family protein [Pyrobaculum sp.]